MDFDWAIATINTLLEEKRPETFNSSWVLRNAPSVYRFLWKNVRTESGGVDWDAVTYAIEWKFQRRWVPGKRRRILPPYENSEEIAAALSKYRDKIYVFIAPKDVTDRRIRDIMSIMLVRIAQRGNLLAKQELVRLFMFTIEDWLERFPSLSRWKGYEEKIREQLEGCIRRYRYTGSFATYVFRTIECAGRSILPFYAYSLDEPVALDADKRKVENVVQDEDSNEIRMYERVGAD